MQQSDRYEIPLDERHYRLNQVLDQRLRRRVGVWSSTVKRAPLSSMAGQCRTGFTPC